jgi:hypothetical protein
MWTTIQADLIPILFSVIGLALGIGPGWSFLWTLKLSAYDPPLAVLTATLIALIWTADYAFHAVRDARRRDAREDNRREATKNAIMGGVFSELLAIYAWLRVVEEDLYHARIWHFDRPMLSEALRSAHLFHEDEIAVLSLLAAQLQIVEGDISRVADSVKRVTTDYQLLDVAQIAKVAPAAVKQLQWAAMNLRATARSMAKELDPESFVEEEWDKLDRALPELADEASRSETPRR